MALTTFSSGVNTSFSSELNGNFDQLNDRLKKFTLVDATEESTTSTTYVTLKTGTITPDDTTDSLIYMVKYSFALGSNRSSSTTTRGRITINSSTIVTKSRTGGLGSTIYSGYAFYTELSPSSSYVVDMDIDNNGDGGLPSVYVKNVDITVYMIQGEMPSESVSFS